MSDHPFKEYREKAGLSQEELAEKLGVSRQMVGLIETGTRPITAKKAVEWEKLIPVSRHLMCPEIFGPPPTGRSAAA
jgi:transcriptional regulator with XRE-family HTH domain